MIVDKFIEYFFFLPISYILSFFPAYTGLPASLETGIDYLASFTSTAGDIFPIGTFYTIIGLTLTLEAGILAFTTVAWLIHWRQK